MGVWYLVAMKLPLGNAIISGGIVFKRLWVVAEESSEAGGENPAGLRV